MTARYSEVKDGRSIWLERGLSLVRCSSNVMLLVFTPLNAMSIGQVHVNHRLV